VHVAAHLGSHLWGGAERAVTLLLRGLAGRGHRVTLYCNDPLVADGARALGVPTVLEPLGGDVAVHHAIRFARTLRRDRPDALIVGTFKKLWLAALAARIAGVPRVVARIGLETDTPRNAKYRFVMSRWVDDIVLTASATRAAYLDVLPGFDRAHLHVIHGAVAARAATLDRAAARQALGLGATTPVIGAVARLARQKRFDRLLRVVQRLPAEVHCVLAGEGEERAALEQLARELGVAGRVHLLGRRDDVGNVLAALDVFVLTSDREGLSNAMLEALASGVPVISTPVSGARDALEALPGEPPAGEIVSFDDGEIATAIARVLGDRRRLAAMSRAALERARDRFDFDAMLVRWESLLATGESAARLARSGEPA
jgi:glycosyltransferase involved in cell wall biosynthesis